MTFARPHNSLWPEACIIHSPMTSTSRAVGQRRRARQTTVIPPTPEKRQQENVGMGTVAVALAGLALAVMNYMF
jgi:hypothetical protein